jgi:hypothetical protein
MKREDDQQLWDLLGQASEPKLSPFFARNLVRTVRQRSRGFESLRRWFTRGRLVPVAGVALACIVALVALHRPGVQKSDAVTRDVIAQIDPQDYDVVADLDELLVTDESNLWDDDAQSL